VIGDVRHKNMRFLKLALITLVVGVLAVWLILPPSIHTWRITDVTVPQERQFSDWFNSWSTGLLAIRISGHSERSANLTTPLGTIQVGPGKFDYITYAHEAWSSRARVTFMPLEESEDSDGEVMIQVCLGFTPQWVKATPENAQLVFPQN